MTPPGDENLASLEASFADPDPTVAPVPQWWLDGEALEDARLTDQLESLSHRGIRGVCIITKHPTGSDGAHPRYFTEEWWAHVEHIAHECDRLGMELWVHDGTYHTSPPKWYAFWQNRIRVEAGANTDLRGRVLHRVSADVEDGESVELELPDGFEALSVAAYPRREDGILDLDAAVGLDVVDGRVTWPGRANHWHVAAVGTRPAGLCYTTQAVVDRYIDLHYEEYVRRLGDLVGDVLVGTFEDELHLLEETIPCDERVLERFRGKHGYDPRSELIALYEPCASTVRLRTDYYDVVVSLLEENWFEPLFEWHEAHGLQRAHDNWGRNDLANGTEQYGDYYRTMRWYHAPGYDDGGPKAIGFRNFFDAKLASSIAACYERERVWGELFHSTTWGFRPENQLAGLIENFCYGCNLYDNACLWYTTRGGWWEHAPGDVHFRQPYWDDVGGLNAAAARLSRLFSAGNLVVDVALAFPIASLHADWHPDEGIGARGHEIDERTQELAASLYGDGLDFILADDESLGRAGSDGHLELSGMNIPALVLPPATAISANTLDAALHLYESGGVVVASERLPVALVGNDNDLDASSELDEALSRLFGADYQDAQSGEANDEVITEHPSGGVAVFVPSCADVADVVRSSIDASIRVNGVTSDDTNESETADEPSFPDRPAADLFHTHRLVAGGDAAAYLFLNTRDEPLTVRVGLRTAGSPERWDPFTGETRQIHEFDRVDGYTEIELAFGAHEFRVIVVDTSSERVRPRVVESGIEVTDVGGRPHEDPIGDEAAGDSPIPETPTVRGYPTDSEGSHDLDVRVRAVDGEVSYIGGTEARRPTTVDVGDRWEFEVRPSLDNRWGDFRYPKHDGLIGVEIKALAHRRERDDEDGIAAGWHRPELAADGWDEVLPTYGPYFYRKRGTAEAGPGATPDALEDAEVAGWEPYEFSLTLGKPGTHPYMLGYMATVSDNFLVSPPEGDEFDTTYFWTTVHVPDEGTYLLHHGPGIRTVQLGIREFETARRLEGDWGLYQPPPHGGSSVAVHLPAGTTPLLLAVDPGVETYLAFDPVPGTAFERDMTFIPRVRWFHEDGQGGVSFDPRPDEASVGWYRFDAPAGTRTFTLPVRGEARVWVDGEERVIGDERVELDSPLETMTSVAVRVEQELGAYGGATWSEPIAVETDPVTIDLADWRSLGLESYSGRGLYRTTVTLPDVADGDRVTLELGDLTSAASIRLNGESVGSTFSHPFELDVSDRAKPGENLLEIEVANTLANHFEHETPRVYGSIERAWKTYLPSLPETNDDYRYAGGLLGPVRLRIDPLVEFDLEPA